MITEPGSCITANTTVIFNAILFQVFSPSAPQDSNLPYFFEYMLNVWNVEDFIIILLTNWEVDKCALVSWISIYGFHKKFDTEPPTKMSIFKLYRCELLRRLVAFVKKIPPVKSYSLKLSSVCSPNNQQEELPEMWVWHSRQCKRVWKLHWVFKGYGDDLLNHLTAFSCPTNLLLWFQKSETANQQHITAQKTWIFYVFCCDWLSNPNDEIFAVII